MNFRRSMWDNERPIRSTEDDPGQLPRQIVTLAFLAENIPDSLISEQLAHSLCAETEASVALVRLERQADAGGQDDGIRPELFLNGEFHMPPHVRRTDAGYFSLILGIQS